MNADDRLLQGELRLAIVLLHQLPLPRKVLQIVQYLQQVLRKQLRMVNYHQEVQQQMLIIILQILVVVKLEQV